MQFDGKTRFRNTFAIGICVLLGAGPLPSYSKQDKAYSNAVYEGPKVLFIPFNGQVKEKQRTEGCPYSGAPSTAEVPTGGKDEAGAALAVLALGWAIEAGTTYIIKWLEQRAKEYSASTSAKNIAVLPNEDRFLGCLVYVHGKFGETTLEGTSQDDVWTEQRLKERRLITRPSQYMEFWMYYVDAKRTTVTLEPVLIDYAGTAAKRISNDKMKDLGILVTFDAPKPTPATQSLEGNASSKKAPADPNAANGKAAADANAGGGKETVGASAKSKTEVPAESQAILSMPFAFQKMPLGTRLTRAVLRDTSRQAQPLSTLDASRPMNVTITVVETENGGDLLLQLSNAIKSNQSDIDKNLLEWAKKALGLDSATKEAK